MQLTRHDAPGAIVSKRAAHLLARVTTRVLEQRVYEQDTLTADLPDVDPQKLTHLEDDGVARIGTEVSGGMVLIGRLVPRRGQPEPATTEAVDRAFGVPEGRDGSLRCPHGLLGIIDSITMEDGAKKNDPRVIKVSVLSEFPLRVGDVLEANGERAVVTAIVDDDAFELKWPGLEGPYEVTRLEPFAQAVVHARSIGPYSLVTDQPLGGREQFGGQRVTAQQLDALLDRGAKHTVHELITVKSDDAKGRMAVFESIVRSAPAAQPGIPHRTRTLERLLISLGFDVDLTWNVPRIKLLTGAALKELAPGVVRKPETINYRTLRPEKDGLFCEHIFGAVDSPDRAVNLGHIELAVPLLHPLAREAGARALGLSERKFEAVLLGEATLGGEEPGELETTGPVALRAALTTIDPKWATLFVEAWPVLPPSLRPLVPLEGGRFATSDLNDLYRRLINRNNRTRRLLELNAPVIITRNEVRMLQEALDCLVQNDAPKRHIKGPNQRDLLSLAEFLTDDRSALRSVSKRVDYSGVARPVVVSGERVKLPSTMAFELFKPWLYARLERAGRVTKIKEARREVEQRSALAHEAMSEEAKDAALLLFGLERAAPVGVSGFDLWDEPAMGLPERVWSRLGVLPGESVVVHVPVDPHAVAEVKALGEAQPGVDGGGGWLKRASTAADPLAELMRAALAEEADQVTDRLTRLLLARM